VKRRKILDLNLTSDDYKKRLDRIDVDNSVEQALYYPIQLLLESILDERFWITDISRRCKNDLDNTDAVPDLMIFDENQGISKGTSPDSVAVVEIKYFPWKNISLDASEKQAYGYLEKTSKVIYTNGIEWRFLSKENGTSRKETICLGNDDNKPRSYYEIIDENKQESQIHWKEPDELNKAWEDLKHKIKDFI